jgi:hypothetical protein
VFLESPQLKKLIEQEAGGEELPQQLMTLLEAILSISLRSACLIFSGEKHNFQFWGYSPQVLIIRISEL